MAIAVLHSPPAMTGHQYDEVVRRFAEAGAAEPPGRRCHFAFGSPDQVRVLDICETQDTLAAFGPVIESILQAIEVVPGDVEFGEVRNIVFAMPSNSGDRMDQATFEGALE